MAKDKKETQRQPDESGGLLIPILTAALVCVGLFTAAVIGIAAWYASTAEQRALASPSTSQSESQPVWSQQPVRGTTPEQTEPAGTDSPDPSESEPVELPTAEPSPSAEPSTEPPVQPSTQTSTPPSASPSASAAPSVSPSTAPSSNPPESQAPASNTPSSTSQIGNSADYTDPNGRTIYITNSGERYHYDNHCNGGNYYPGTWEQVQIRKLTPCNKCVVN